MPLPPVQRLLPPVQRRHRWPHDRRHPHDRCCLVRRSHPLSRTPSLPRRCRLLVRAHHLPPRSRPGRLTLQTSGPRCRPIAPRTLRLQRFGPRVHPPAERPQRHPSWATFPPTCTTQPPRPPAGGALDDAREPHRLYGCRRRAALITKKWAGAAGRQDAARTLVAGFIQQVDAVSTGKRLPCPCGFAGTPGPQQDKRNPSDAPVAGPA
jgi:hypothetical protein